jgi:hypothetical protein
MEEDVDHLPARVFLDHFCPRRQHLGVAVGYRRQEVMQLQGHLRLCEGGAGNGRRSQHRAGCTQESAAR